MIKCKCNFRQKMVGDGCDQCNPELDKELQVTAEEHEEEYHARIQQDINEGGGF